jgi:hypothetical protein
MHYGPDDAEVSPMMNRTFGYGLKQEAETLKG